MLRHYHTALCAAGVDDYDFDNLVGDYWHAMILVLALLDLPFLVAEANVDEANRPAFAEVREVWFERLAAVIADYDYEWLARHSRFASAQLRAAILGSLAKKRAVEVSLKCRPPA